MSKKKDGALLKKASFEAREFIKRINKHKFSTNIVLSVIILAVGITLGLAFDEFELFLSIAVALDIVTFIINRDNNI